MGSLRSVIHCGYASAHLRLYWYTCVQVWAEMVYVYACLLVIVSMHLCVSYVIRHPIWAGLIKGATLTLIPDILKTILSAVTQVKLYTLVAEANVHNICVFKFIKLPFTFWKPCTMYISFINHSWEVNN